MACGIALIVLVVEIGIHKRRRDVSINVRSSLHNQLSLSQLYYLLTLVEMSHSESKAQAAAAAAAEMAQEILFAEARAIDVTYTKYFAAGMVGLVALFTIVNWVQIIFNKYGSRSNTFARAAAAISRPLRRPLKGLTIGGFAILPSRLALAAAYFGINLALMFTQINWTVQVIFAKRCGW